MEFPRREFDGDGVKADVDFGPTLMLNRNRCILCTRCVRFMRDVDGDAQINIIDRGYGSEIATFQEEGVHSLISGNLMDVCPVGAITTRDYRFKSRPWDNPHAADTICTQCSKGCNITRVDQGQAGVGEGIAAHPVHAAVQSGRQRLLDVRHRAVRVPLDRGRGSSSQAARSRQPAPERPRIRRARGFSRAWRPRPSPGTTPWPRSRKPWRRGRANIDGVRFLISAHASHEELFLFRRLNEELIGEPVRAVTAAWTVREKHQPADTKLRGPGGGRAERERRAYLRPRRATSERRSANPTPRRSAAGASWPARSRRWWCSSPGPEGSLGDVDRGSSKRGSAARCPCSSSRACS